MKHAVEIRSYNLVPDSRESFHELVGAVSIPMLRRWGVDVVHYGPSLHDDDSYCLIRAYKSLAERQASQDAFYASPEWREGPRSSIISMIESTTSVVLDLDDATLAGLRAL